MARRRGGARSAAEVRDGRGWREQHAPAARADRRAEIDVLGVEKISFVEQADRFRVAAVHQQAAPLTQSTNRSVPRGAFDPLRDRTEAALMQQHHELLAQFGDRRNHRAERELGPAGRVDESRAGDAASGCSSQPRDQRIQRAAPGRACRCSAAARARRSWLECRRCSRRANPRLRDCTRTCIAGQRARRRQRSVARRVVDDDDVVRDGGRVGGERLEAALEIVPRVEADDDNRQLGCRHRRAIRSSSLSVFSAACSHENRASTAGPRPSWRRPRPDCQMRTQRLRRSVDVGCRDVLGRWSVHLPRHRRIQDDDRDAGGESLERRQPESLVLREEREHRGPRVQRCQLPVVT